MLIQKPVRYSWGEEVKKNPVKLLELETVLKETDRTEQTGELEILSEWSEKCSIVLFHENEMLCHFYYRET